MNKRLHLLHIGKTGGNAVQFALRPYLSAELQIVFHPHETALVDIPNGEQVCFTLREPTDRFVSGFNSRFRRGRPLRNSAWNDQEAEAFANFRTPDNLAISMSSPDQALQKKALAAMRGIGHVKTTYADWLKDIEYVKARQADILWVGQTSRLTEDFERLKLLLGLTEGCRLPDDPVAAHRRLPSDPIHLSQAAIDNVRSWYASDYRFLAYFSGIGSLRREGVDE